jgi:hypothetical protein
MKFNNFITDLISNSINKITSSQNPHEGTANKEMETRISPPTAAAAQLNGVSKEEQRLFILRMLANKKINIKEANGLLDALEGEPEPICNAHYF